MTGLAPDHAFRPTRLVWGRETAAELQTLCRSDVREALLETYERNRWVYDSIARQPDATRFRGRHPVVGGWLGDTRIVVKRMYHGGLLANVLRDAFLTAGRAQAHVERAEYLRTHGVATSQVVFASWRRVHGLTRCEIGFEMIDGAIDGDDYFFGRTVPPEGWVARAEEIGRVVARLHEIRFLHADLNLMNFLFGPAGEAYILDLDKTARPGPVLSDRERQANLDRLERSIRKQGRNHLGWFVESIVEKMRGSYQRALPAVSAIAVLNFL